MIILRLLALNCLTPSALIIHPDGETVSQLGETFYLFIFNFK